jgi:hypothetical protein
MGKIRIMAIGVFWWGGAFLASEELHSGREPRALLHVTARPRGITLYPHASSE